MMAGVIESTLLLISSVSAASVGDSWRGVGVGVIHTGCTEELSPDLPR